MYNSVQYLQSVHFRQLTLQEKVEIKNKGRSVPLLSLQQEKSSSQGRSFTRKFNQSLYAINGQQHDCRIE